MYNFLLVIDTNVPPILHRFRDIAFDRSKIAIFCYPRMSADGQGTQCRRNIAENYSRLSRVHERYRHATDGRATAFSECKLECGPMPNVMAALPNIGGALCSTPQSLPDAHYSSAVQ